MKTAISIPDSVFAHTDRFARRTKKSRSKVICDALLEYLARHSPDEVTEAMDHAVGLVDETLDPFVDAAGKRMLRQVDW